MISFFIILLLAIIAYAVAPGIVTGLIKLVMYVAFLCIVGGGVFLIFMAVNA